MGSRRRARADIGFNSEIDIGRSSKPTPNFTPYARRWKVQPRPRLRSCLSLVENSARRS